jgi:hypothetical protein
LFALDKLVSSLSPLIGYEAIHGTAAPGWSDGKTKEDVREWNAKAAEEMKDWEQAYWTTEKEAERRGWLKVCRARGRFSGQADVPSASV